VYLQFGLPVDAQTVATATARALPPVASMLPRSNIRAAYAISPIRLTRRARTVRRMNWIDRIKQHWLRRAAGDHPLTEQERTPRADNAIDRNAQSWTGVFGQTAHDPVADDDAPRR
jgi:hypothetical protein